MGRSSPEIIALLEETLAQAKQGEITEVFLWHRTGDETTDYQFLANDMDDMLFELGSAILTERIHLPGVDRPPTKQ